MDKQIKEREVIVKGAVELSATLTIPNSKEENMPAIVLVGGTGGANRDGNVKNFNSNIYKQLAEFFTELGFVTIRYDKRGVGKSKGDQLTSGMLDLVDDVISNVKYLESLPFVDHSKIILVGHSEGCILNTLASRKYPVGGLILLAGAGTSLKTNMVAQIYVLLEEIKHMKGLKGFLLRKLLSEKSAVGRQEKIFKKVLSTDKDVVRMQFMKFPAKWLREHLSYTDQEIQNVLRESSCPIFAVSGDMDVQVNAKDLDYVRALSKSNIQCHVVKEMDHLLREYKGGERTVLNIHKQYKKSFGKPLHFELLEVIEQWLNSNYGGNTDEN